MVVERGDVKRRRKDVQDSLEGSPKRTKVHAQRKFAQGAGMSGQPMTMATPVKEKPKMNGVSSPPPPELSGAGGGAKGSGGPSNRPNTEDFLTFLCFRGTKALPPRLSVFNAPHEQQQNQEGQPEQGAGTSSSSSSSSSPAGGGVSRQTGSSSSAGAGSSSNTPNAARIQEKCKRNSQTRGKIKQSSAVQALKDKYREQRLLRQKVSLTQLARKVKGKNMIRTRSAVLMEERSKKKNYMPEISKAVPSKVRPTYPVILKRLGVSRLRAGLRSSGKLPPGSDIGIKSDRKPRRTLPSKLPPKVVSSKVSKKKLNASGPSSDNYEPVAKKLRPIATRSRGVTKRTAIPPSSLNIKSRPSRKTKEAAAIYMEMLTKDLRSPDEDFEEEEVMSVESLTGPQNLSTSEERESKETPVPKTSKQAKSFKLSAKEKKDLENKKKVLSSKGKSSFDSVKNSSNKKFLESSKDESFGVETRITRKSAGRAKDNSPPQRVLRTKRNRVSLAEDRFSESDDEELYYEREQDQKNKTPQKTGRRSLRRGGPQDQEENESAATSSREMKSKNLKSESRKSVKVEKASDIVEEVAEKEVSSKKVNNKKLETRKTRKVGKQFDDSLPEQDSEQETGHDDKITQDDVKKSRLSSARARRSDTASKVKIEEVQVSTRRHTRQTSLEMSEVDLEENKVASQSITKKKQNKCQGKKQGKKISLNIVENKNQEENEQEKKEILEAEQGDDQSKKSAKLNIEVKVKGQNKIIQNELGSTKVEKKITGDSENLTSGGAEPSEVTMEPTVESAEPKKTINNNNNDDERNEMKHKDLKINPKSHSQIKFKNNSEEKQVKSIEGTNEQISSSSKKPVREGLGKMKKISECSDPQDKEDNNEQLLNIDSTKKTGQDRSKKLPVTEEPGCTILLESEVCNESKGSRESSFQYMCSVGKKVCTVNEKKQKLENEKLSLTNQSQHPSKLKTCDIIETSSVKDISSSALPTPLDRITDSLNKLKAGQLISPLLPNTTKLHSTLHCNFGVQSSSDSNSKVFGTLPICKMETLDPVKPKEELHVVVGSGLDEKYNPNLEQDKKQICHNTLLTNFSVKEKTIEVKEASESIKLEQPTKNNQLAEGVAKPTKPSIGDTWREAFRNAKLPKPGQLSPVPHAVTPFVRKLYVTPKYQMPKSETDRKPNTDAAKPGNFSSPSFSGRRYFPKDGGMSDGPKRLGGLEDLEVEKKPEKVVKSLTQLQYEKKTSELVSGLKDTAVITDDHLLPSTHWSSIEETATKHEVPHNKVESKNKPVDPAKPLSEGKHLNLPLPVEHNLRKHSPTTVTRKPPSIARYQVPQEPVKETKPQVEEPQKKTNDQVAASNESRPIPVVEPPQVLIGKPPSIVADLNIKKKVNMTTEEIKGWLSDSTSSGIKHNKDCDIFKKNQCECSYRTRSSSMEASGGVSQLVPPPLLPCQSVPAVEIGKSVVEPPIRLKELGTDPKYCTETISTCKVEEYKESILSKNAQKNEAKSVKSSPEAPKDLPPPPPMSGKNKKTIGTNHAQNEKVGPKRSRSATDDETSGEFDFRFERSTCSPARESGSELSSPTPRDDVSSSNDDTPEKTALHHEHRKTIFHKRSLNKRPPLSKSPCAFSPENESSVYAFEPDLPFNKPFRRSTGSGGGSGNNGGTKSRVQENAATSSSIAVQVNLETEAVLECSTQTEREVDDEGHLFYIPLQQSPGDSIVPPQQLIQGVAVKLDTEGPDQRVIMRAKLVTKPATTFASSSRSLVATPPTGRSQAPKPEQKVRPLGSTVGTCTTTLVQASKPPPVVGTVQPTVRRTDQSTATVPDDRPEQATQATQATCLPPVATENKPVVKEEPQQQHQALQSPSYPTKQNKRQSADGTGKSKVPATLTAIACSDFPKRGTQPCLVEAPTFKPTEKEFQDPLEYIEKITPLAQQFGICRIIPPSNFKPECKVSDDMRFTAYNQYIHKTLYRWGPNVKEMSAIRKYLATQSITLTQPPLIGGIEVDLPRLYQTVQQCGGLKEVIEKKRWTKVADAMKIPKSAQDRVTKLDDIYCKFLLPYDTLSHEERNKLLKEVEDEWRERERREAIEDSNDASSDNESSDTFDRDECITKGRSMALSAFYRVARNTMTMWFKDNPPSPAEVETEFWRHVSTGQSHICVHSASIDSGTWGYGFPTAKSSSTSRHPWNLKVLTNNPGSVLKSIGPLMGVTVPTLHVGMLFTACCWYRDPHTLPWIEYLHTGASKVWYGVPDEWSNELKTALKGLLPSRLVRDKPVWLPSDTAMVPPSLLVERGVPLCRTVQEPRQFVLVFPKAFTSSICTGYLVSESVYFAQPSWLNTAENVFKDVQESSEPTIFSLEKLLFCIATDTKSSVDVLNQVLPMVMRIRDKEVEMRRELETVGVVATERLPTGKGGGGSGGGGSARSRQPKHHDTHQEYECDTCRATLFLSLVTNSHEDSSYCLTHAVEMLRKDSSQLKYCKLLYNYDEEEMEELVEKVKSKIELKSQKKAHGKANAGSSKN